MCPYLANVPPNCRVSCVCKNLIFIYYSYPYPYLNIFPSKKSTKLLIFHLSFRKDVWFFHVYNLLGHQKEKTHYDKKTSVEKKVFQLLRFISFQVEGNFALLIITIMVLIICKSLMKPKTPLIIIIIIIYFR